MKKIISIALALAMCVGLFAGCDSGGGNRKGVSLGEVVKYGSLAERLEAYGLDADRKFVDQRNITVTIYNRSNDGGTDPTNNMYTDYIKEGMLREHNVVVEFNSIPRWEEVAVLNNLLAAGTAPDVGVTYNINTIETYGKMDAVWDLHPLLDESEELFPHLWDLLGRTNIYYNQDPTTNHIWAIEAIMFNNMRINTFVREDWLKALDLDEPTTEAEFEAMLEAFRDNAELLLGNDANQMVPFGLAQDVGWLTSTLIESYIPNEISDREWYIHGLGDRRLLMPGVKEATRTLNRWYNDGLIDPDFALYPQGDSIYENKMKAGFVGAFIHNWDYPYREGENGITASLHRLFGEDAGFIVVDTFPNDAGIYRKYLSAPVDRKLFFPSTNTEPVASMLYLDFISNPVHRQYLQIGEEGITHEIMPDGAVRAMPASAPNIINSPNNIDYTITLNGLDVGDPELNARSVALGYAMVPSRLIEKAYAVQKTDTRISAIVNVGIIDSEEGIGQTIRDRADALWATSIVASPNQFDSVFDSAMDNIMRNYGNASIEERAAKWTEFYGDAEWLR